MRDAPELLLPSRPRPGGWRALLASVLVHLVVFAIPGAYLYQSSRDRPDVPLLRFDANLRAVDMFYQPRQQAPVRPPPTIDVQVAVAPDALGPPVAQPAAAPTGLPRPAVDTGGGAPPAVGPGSEAQGGLRPALGDGRLWVEPLPLPPAELARRLTRSHYELLDSAVTAVVQAYLDSVIASPTPYGNAPPSWTTKIAGKTFGIDNRFIYLGGLRIPTAVLALMPIPPMSNVDLRYTQRLAAMREDLMMAAQRARTMEDFKQAVKQLREEQERQRELERNQRRTPADTIPSS